MYEHRTEIPRSACRLTLAHSCRPYLNQAQWAPVSGSKLSEVDNSRCDSIWSRSSSILRWASAMTSAPAMNRRGGGSSSTIVSTACASLSGSPACWPS